MNIAHILSKSVFGLMLLISFNAAAQQQPSLICTMDQRQVMQSQPFSEDAVEAEAARDLFQDFTNTLILAYDHINSNSLEEVQIQISAINTYLETFQTQGLNYSMFQDDIDFILNYN